MFQPFNGVYRELAKHFFNRKQGLRSLSKALFSESHFLNHKFYRQKG